MTDSQMQYFIIMLDNILSSIHESFWKIVRADGAYIIRERAFCYELYHQLRKCQEQCKGEYDEEKWFTRINITGEIDKRGYPLLQSKDSPNPDFVFHEMGSNAHNEIVMEVKGRTDENYEKEIIQKDFKNLALFIGDGGLRYNLGVFLLYGHDMDELKQVIRKNHCLLRQTIEGNCGDSYSAEEICKRIIVITKRSRDSSIECRRLCELYDKFSC